MERVDPIILSGLGTFDRIKFAGGGPNVLETRVLDRINFLACKTRCFGIFSGLSNLKRGPQIG